MKCSFEIGNVSFHVSKARSAVTPCNIECANWRDICL